MNPNLQATMVRHSPPRHLVLLSGGVDSALCLHWAAEDARRRGGSVTALTIGYGQPVQEQRAAARLAAHYRVGYHLTLSIDAPFRVDFEQERTDGLSAAYLPQRNTILLAQALAVAEDRRARVIWVGFNADDAEGFPDTRPGYVKAFQRFANTAWAGDGRAPLIDTPLSTFTKAEVVAAARKHGVPLGLCWSCYTPTDEGEQCGACESCLLVSGDGKGARCACPPGRCANCMDAAAPEVDRG